MTTEMRIRDLIRHPGPIGHSFAFWLGNQHYATKSKAGLIRLFESLHSSSKPADSRLLLECSETGGAAYCAIAETLEVEAAQSAQALNAIL